jgi:cellulose biosynthesis protein BcsQ
VWSLFMPIPKRMRTMRSSRGVSDASMRVVVSRRFDWIAALEQRGCTLAIIDTPGSDNDFVAAAIRAANLCLVPARPSQADIEATVPTLKVIRGLDKEFAFVLTQTPARGQRPTRVALALSEAGVLALPYIVLRNDHMDSLAAGLAVSEFAPDSIAAAEIRSLWAWSKQKLTVNQCAQCGAGLITPEWSEHFTDHRIRRVWSCKACGYQFETHSLLVCA